MFCSVHHVYVDQYTMWCNYKAYFFLKQAIFTKDLISRIRRLLSWTDRFTTSRPNSRTGLTEFLHTQKCTVGTCRTGAGELHGASLQPSSFYFKILMVLLLLKRRVGEVEDGGWPANPTGGHLLELLTVSEVERKESVHAWRRRPCCHGEVGLLETLQSSTAILHVF